MSEIENPPAFPVVVPELWHHVETGMTLRDWFAGQTLAGAMVGSYSSSFLSPKAAAEMASEVYLVADAMLAERAKGGSSC